MLFYTDKQNTIDDLLKQYREFWSDIFFVNECQWYVMQFTSNLPLFACSDMWSPRDIYDIMATQSA